jgi:hypothetical protein
MRHLARKIWDRVWLIRHVPYWVFLIVFIFSALVAVSALRHNNQRMIELRNAVYTADKNNGDINGALNNLRKYVYSHMNTNLASGGNAIKPPIQLKYTYERLQAASSQSANNSGLYTQAENYCQARIPASVSISGRGRIACVQDYILSHGGNKGSNIPVALYEFDFVSPSWSPDLAGWSLVITFLLLILTVGTYLIDRLVNAKLKPL